MPSCDVPSCEVLRTGATVASACCPRVLPSRGAALDPSPAIIRRVTSSSTAEDGLRLRSAIITRFESCGAVVLSVELSVELSGPMLSVVLSAPMLSVVLSDPVPSAVLSAPGASRTSLPSCVTSFSSGRGRAKGRGAGAGQVVAPPMLLGFSPRSAAPCSRSPRPSLELAVLSALAVLALTTCAAGEGPIAESSDGGEASLKDSG